MSEEINNITAEEMGSKTWIFHEPWPIDPNAPKNTPQDWINKGYKLVVIGGGLNKAYSKAWEDVYKHIELGSDVVVHHSPEMSIDMLVEHVARVNGGLGKVGPIPIKPIELKIPKNRVL